MHYFRWGEFVRAELVKLDYVDRDARFDDFDLGDRISILAGLSPTLFGLDRTTGMLGAAASRGWRAGEGTLLLPQLTLESRVGAEADNTIATGSLRFVHRFRAKLTQTLVSRLEVRRGWDLDPEVYLIDQLPVAIVPLDYLIIACVSLGISALSTIVPSWLTAARLKPIDGLRYE